MPELPEAENVRTRLHKYGAGRTITHVRVTEDSIVFSGVTADEFADKLKNQKIKTAHRWGKYFWLEFENSGNMWPIFHLGMSGSVRVRHSFENRIRRLQCNAYPQFLESNGEDIHGAASDSDNDQDAEGEDDEASALEADDEDFDRLKETAEKEQEEAVNPPQLKRRKSSTVSPRPDWPPRWWKFVLILDDGTQISFADCRRLGRVFLHQGPDPKEHTALKKLGFDALLSVPDQAEFDALVARRSLPLKALLLNQAFAAGVGNWIADEVLYQARLHPERRANTLSKEELVSLRDKIIYIVKTAVTLKTQSKRLPEDWLFHRRWSKVAAKKETQKTIEGHEIAFATVGGRTSAFVPALQPAPEGFVNDDNEGKKTTKKTKNGTKSKNADGGKKKTKSKRKKESDDEMEASLSADDDSDSEDHPAPIIRRASSSRLSRQSSKKSLKEESSDEEDNAPSAGESDDDFVSVKKPKKRKSKLEEDEPKEQVKFPKRKRSKLADVKDEELPPAEEESRPAPAKRKRSEVDSDVSSDKPKLNRRKSATKPKKEPGEGH